MADSLESQFKERIPKSQHALIDSLEADGAESIIRFLQSYVLVPLNQFVSRQSPSLAVPKSWNLSWQHQTDVSELLASHRGYLKKFERIDVTPWLQAKAETFVLQARSIIDKLQVLRALQVPGGKDTYVYFLKFCLYAPLANFVDPNSLPMDIAEAPPSHVEQHALFPAKFVSEMLTRFKEEGFKFTPEQIRELIAKRNEMEKANILRKMSSARGATKDIIKLQMRLGIGEWAVGGTKAIYAYDADLYDRERDQRAEAGIVDFPGFGPEGPGGQDYFGMAEGGQEEGYIGNDELGDINGFDDDN
jgi:hypothetical protein